MVEWVKRGWRAISHGSTVYGLLPSTWVQAGLAFLAAAGTAAMGVIDGLPLTFIFVAALLALGAVPWAINQFALSRERNRVEHKLHLRGYRLQAGHDVVDGQWVLTWARIVVDVYNASHLPIRFRAKGVTIFDGRIADAAEDWRPGDMRPWQTGTINFPPVIFRPPVPLEPGSLINGTTKV